MTDDGLEGVLITGVFGSGKSSVAAEIDYLLERSGQPKAMLDLDYLGWAGTAETTRSSEVALMLTNLAAVAANYRRAGIRRFVLAYFIRDAEELQGVREAAGVPLRVVRLEVDAAEINRRLAADVMSGRQDDLHAAIAALAAREGEGLEDVVVAGNQPVTVIASEVLRFLGWSGDDEAANRLGAGRLPDRAAQPAGPAGG